MHDAASFPRRFALAALIAATAALALPSVAPAQSVSVVIDGQPLSMNPGPIERAGRVFVPLRAIFERLGAMVVYQSGTINATKGPTTISLTIGSTQATIGGQPQILDVAPFIIGATTYVPLRFVAQSLGANVNYNDSTQTVSIGTGRPPVPVQPVRPLPPPNPPPVSIVRLLNVQPPAGTSVANRFATISANFSNQVNPGSVRVWIDGGDVTSQASITRAAFSFRPPAPLGFGSHTIRVAGFDAGGSRFDRSWSFAVNGAPPPPPVNPVQLNALQPGSNATTGNRFVTISAQFSRQVNGGSVSVLLDGANITSQCGVSGSAFSYKPPAPLAFGAHTVRVRGRDLGGAAFDRSWSFTVSRPAPVNVPLTIQSPGQNAVVGKNFVIRGTTVANGRVEVTAGATPSFTGQFRDSTTAGPAGGFNVRVQLNTLIGQQSVKIRIRVTAPGSGQTAETTLQLRLNQ